MVKLPIKTRKIAKALRQVRKEASRDVNILVAGREGVDATGLIEELAPTNEQRAIFKTLTLDRKSTEELIEEACAIDFALILLDMTQQFDVDTLAFVVCLAELKKPFLIVVDDFDASGFEEFHERIKQFLEISPTRIVSISIKRGLGIRTLIQKILDRCNKEIALASRLPSFRKAAIEKVIRETAAKNALIGGITILPGSDMPILTANQIRMVLKIAAIHGEKLTLARCKELLAVVGAGFTFRALARQLLDLLPGPGWIIKGGVAYGGTVALGRLAKKYFEGDRG
ncbi:MAG: hypothetical protein QME54_02505 [Actinomycetota bacterium]|nr:hypothetical protein [Actinomycetota bacterium]